MEWTDILIGLIGCIIGVVLCICWEFYKKSSLRWKLDKQIALAHEQADAIIKEAQQMASQKATQIKAAAEEEAQKIISQAVQIEAKAAQREQLLNEQLERLTQLELELHKQYENLFEQKRNVEREKEELSRLLEAKKLELEKIAKMSEEEAKLLLYHEVEQQALKDANDLSDHIIREAKENAEREARRILSTVIQRYSAPLTNELTTCSISLTDPELKGRIIGRDGRNIKAFEAATGVTVLIDEIPGIVILSSFDPVRREIARIAMEKLIADGRIHPTRIEEVVKETTTQMEQWIKEAGEEAIRRVGLPPMAPEITNTLGSLKFRKSYSQNLLEHSIEVAILSGLLAAEMGVPILIAKKAGLLHDIGKALNHELQGSHAKVGADFLRRLGEPEIIVNAVLSHHDENPPQNEIGIIVAIADTISAARPGARSESTTQYIQRLEALEQIGMSFPGVEKCYAVQAGRELRVIVRPEEITDEQARVLARNLARKIENELQYPGQIRVTVIRETRCVEYAK